jgi:ABC-type phosphate transport system auxiliary subunit
MSVNEKISGKERQDIWVELQSLRLDTQAFRTEVHRLRTTGSLDTATNERLRARQTELERRGEVLIKRCVHFFTSLSLPSLRRHRLSPQLEWRTDSEQTSGTSRSLPLMIVTS